MSRIGRKPVDIPQGVTVKVQGTTVQVKGPKGELSRTFPAVIQPAVRENRVEIGCAKTDRLSRALHGTARSLVANMVKGAQQGYAKELEIQGVGFRAALQGRKLVLSLGYSHPIEFPVPDGIAIKVAENIITVSGPDKQQVGEVSARLRSFYPPEPYKGKGVRLRGEYVRRKVGKTVA